MAIFVLKIRGRCSNWWKSRKYIHQIYLKICQRLISRKLLLSDAAQPPSRAPHSLLDWDIQIWPSSNEVKPLAGLGSVT